jgi:hypothetical protein
MCVCTTFEVYIYFFFGHDYAAFYTQHTSCKLQPKNNDCELIWKLLFILLWINILFYFILFYSIHACMCVCVKMCVWNAIFLKRHTVESRYPRYGSTSFQRTPNAQRREKHFPQTQPLRLCLEEKSKRKTWIKSTKQIQPTKTTTVVTVCEWGAPIQRNGAHIQQRTCCLIFSKWWKWSKFTTTTGCVFRFNVQAKERVARTNDSVVVYLSLSEFGLAVCELIRKYKQNVCEKEHSRSCRLDLKLEI